MFVELTTEIARKTASKAKIQEEKSFGEIVWQR